MMKAAVCDDHEMYAKRLEGVVSDTCRVRGTGVSVSRYTDSGMLLYDVEEGADFDLFLLDIEMPGLDGMQLAGKIRKCLPGAVVIFITSHTEYAIKAYELSVFRYIPKSELETCLPLALTDAFSILERRSRECYLIETPRKLKKIAVDEILYIYKDQKNSVFVLKEEKVQVRKPLSQVIKELNRPEFLMVERGYVVNLYHVMKLEDGEVHMRGGDVLPVGSSHQKEVRSAVVGFWRSCL